MFSVLRIRPYRRLFGAQFFALMGTGVLTVALGLLAYDIAGGDAGIVLGFALMVKMFAYVVLTPFLSAWGAQFRAKNVLIFSDAVRAGAALLLPFVTDAWQIYILIFVLQSASALFTPSFQATIPEVVHDEDQYTQALTLARISYDAESLASPVIAAALLTIIPFDQLFIGTTVGFLLSAGIILRTQIPEVRRARDTTFLHRLLEGLAAFLRQRELRGLLGLNLALSASTSMVVVNSVVVVRDELGGAEPQVALVLASFGLGSVITALVAPRLVRRRTDYSVMLVGAAATPVLLVSLAITLYTMTGADRWWAVAPIWFLFGLCSSTVLTLSGRLLRRFSDPDSRSSIFSAYFSLSHAFLFAMYPLAGTVGATAGLPTAAAILAAVSLTGIAACVLVWRRGPALR